MPDSYISAELSILFFRTRFSSRDLGKYILSLRGYFVPRGAELLSLVNLLLIYFEANVNQ